MIRLSTGGHAHSGGMVLLPQYLAAYLNYFQSLIWRTNKYLNTLPGTYQIRQEHHLTSI